MWCLCLLSGIGLSRMEDLGGMGDKGGGVTAGHLTYYLRCHRPGYHVIHY